MYFNPIKAVVFDLDGTLAESKSPIRIDMADILCKLLSSKMVLIMSGGSFDQFKSQLLLRLEGAKFFWKNLYLMPTSGAEFLCWNSEKNDWEKKYSFDFKDEEFEKIKIAFKDALEKAGVAEEFKDRQIHGEQIENRGPQITFSALGQKAPLTEKIEWDPEVSKRRRIVEELKKLIPEYTIQIGGSTSIDITKKGIDKAFGIQAFMKNTGVRTNEILFIGDSLFPGGNDATVLRTGIKTIKVANPNDTYKVITNILSPHQNFRQF